VTRLLIAQPSPSRPPGLLLPWARDRGIVADVVALFRGDRLPPPTEADGIVVLGAPVSVNNADVAWAATLRAWVAHALAVDVPVLGIGYGARVMASVLGGEVVDAPRAETGWIRIVTAHPALADGPWIACARETILMPEAHFTVAFNGFGTQAFTSGPHLGVLFHPEATPDVAAGWSELGQPPSMLPVSLAVRAARALFSGWATAAGIEESTREHAVVSP
jgi:GMP synthase-like glutamine amidotransferase